MLMSVRKRYPLLATVTLLLVASVPGVGPAQAIPGFPPGTHVEWLPVRFLDEIIATLPLRTGGARHVGVWYTDIGTTRLYRNGSLVGESNSPGFAVFKVPPEPSDYRLTVETTQVNSRYGTELSSVWTFRSGRNPVPTLLPLLGVSFSVPVDLENRALRGRTQRLPITVWRADATPVKLARLTVEVSFDDGRTWNRLRVRHFGQGWEVHFRPKRGMAVSLRTTAVDRDGNTVTQTMIRAYGLK